MTAPKGTLTPMQIVEVAHAANAAYSKTSMSQVPSVVWGQVDVVTRDSTRDAVLYVLTHQDVTAREMHARWVASKLEQGWIPSGVLDRSVRGHPNLRPFDELPIWEQLKDHLFLGVVKALLRPYTVADTHTQQTPPTPSDGEGSSPGSADVPDDNGGNREATPRPGPGGAPSKGTEDLNAVLRKEGQEG